MKDYPFLVQLDARIPGFLNDLQPLMAVSEQLLAVVPDTEFKRAVNGQIDVAIEHYGGMLAMSANGFGLPAEALARNLFDLVTGTLYLMQNSTLLPDFIEFGQLSVYRLMRNLRPVDPQHQHAQARDLASTNAEFTRLKAKFDRKNFWHRKQIAEIAETVGMGQLYKTFYKVTSGITHGSSYPILSRDENLEWLIGFRRADWHRYVKESVVFGYLMLGYLFTEAFHLFYLTDVKTLDNMANIAMKLMSEP